MRGMQGTRGMFTRNPGKFLMLAFRGMLKKIPGNVPVFVKCLRIFRRMFQNISGNAIKHTANCY